MTPFQQQENVNVSKSKENLSNGIFNQNSSHFKTIENHVPA